MKSDLTRCSSNCKTCTWSSDDCLTCSIGLLRLEEAYLSHEKLNFRLINEESSLNEGDENHRAVKSKCVEVCPPTNKNMTIIENRIAGQCM